ncbi:MAG: hypothetical protein IKP40_10815 [Clostridia bacterium]|nr:hypothetical protein [Clostridia bacterium]
MVAIQGYFDGVTIRPLEELIAKPNQRVIITVMDEFVEPDKLKQPKGLRGILSSYADSSLVEKEGGAWERAAVKKHGDT